MNDDTLNDLTASVSATDEVYHALLSALDRGILTALDLGDEGDVSTAARWWRGEDGVLYATAPTIVERGAVRVWLRWEAGAGWEAMPPEPAPVYGPIPDEVYEWFRQTPPSA